MDYKRGNGPADWMPGSETIVISELVDEKPGAGGVEYGRMTMVSDAGQ